MKKRAAIVGFFDGVHLGHQKLISELERYAAEHDLEPLIVSFNQHPKSVTCAGFIPVMLQTQPDRTQMLLSHRNCTLQLFDFTPAFAEKSSREFMQILHTEYNVDAILLGYNNRFGCDKDFTPQKAVQTAAELGMDLVVSTPLLYKNLPISSSRIRRELSQGNITDANSMLGWNYYVSGMVVKGLQNGRKIGFPTANINPDCINNLIPERGVYAAYVILDGKRYAAMANVGYNPTIAEHNHLSVEAHILDFDRNIYGKRLTLEFASRIRNEQRFGGLQELAAQLCKDREQIRALLGQ